MKVVQFNPIISPNWGSSKHPLIYLKNYEKKIIIIQNEHIKRIYCFQQTKPTHSTVHSLEMSQLRNSYLFLYNLLQAAGWYHSPSLSLCFLSPSTHNHAHPSVSTYRTVSLFRVLSSFISSKSTNGAFSSAGELICECPQPINMDVCILFSH